MDIFVFDNPTAKTKMEQGEIVKDLTSKTWVERYDKAGEFKLVAPASTGIRSKLPIGSFVSHTETQEIMIIENHEIADKSGADADIIISGRGYETFFENRIVGSNKTYPTSTGVTEYVLSADNTWNQAVTLIKNHIVLAFLTDANDELPYCQVNTTASGSGASIIRSIKRGDLYTRLLELLAVEGLGIKVIRPGPWSPLGGSSPDVDFVIHQGVDRSSQVMFSYDTGEIVSADYLWSGKKFRNTAMVSGKWVETLVTTAATKSDRRMMFLEASDIDNSYSAAPTGASLTDVIAKMQQRGIEALAAQTNLTLTKAEVSKDNTRAQYRKDFDVGDIILVNGDYNATAKMRISEYVEIEDQKGSVGYPTLIL